MHRRSFWTRPAVLLGLALCAFAALLTIVSRFTGGSNASKAVALSTGRGAVAYPSFAPDGRRLVFSVRLTKDEDFHLFTRGLPSGSDSQLTSAAASDVGAAWSPDGATVAFLRVQGDEAACMIVLAGGGPEHKLAACAALPDKDNPLPAVAWTPDGKSLAVSAAGENQLPAIALVPAAGGPIKRPRILPRARW